MTMINTPYHKVKKYLQSDWLVHACYYQYSIFLRVKILER